VKPKKVIFASIDEYIATFPEDVQGMLEEIRATVKSAAPGAEEKISYHMPAFALNGSIAHFAAFKHHIGFFGSSDASPAFKKEVARYAGPKGNLKFPIGQPLPLKLIRHLVKKRVADNLRKAKKKSGKKK
jgi:uncharacterized protein YdhG (YjbR/CyaY superfamily)